MDLSKLNIPEKFKAEIPILMDKFGINTPLRLAHFLAQVSHESGGFKVGRENLNYSADGLQKIFKKYFPTPELANAYARQPEKIANKVYANRLGNGDEASGDGWKYRGAGGIQLTGKDNFKAFSDAIGEDCVANPELVADKYYLSSAAWFWKKNGLNEMADKGNTGDVVTSVSKRVNGGTIGLSQRLDEFKHFNSQLNA